jgi:hypothetical protein
MNKNEDAIQYHVDNKPHIIWSFLSTDKSGIPLLEINSDKINKNQICKNKNAVHIVEKYIKTMPIKQQNKELNRYYLSKNPSAVNLLEQHPQIIDWCFLTENKNAVHIVEKYLNYDTISKNSGSIEFIEEILSV